MNLSQQGIQQYIENRSIYIIDNTQLPCQNGTYFQFLNPWISLGNLYIIDNSAYVAEAICNQFAYARRDNLDSHPPH